MLVITPLLTVGKLAPVLQKYVELCSYTPLMSADIREGPLVLIGKIDYSLW